jgi:dynein assembly factor 3
MGLSLGSWVLNHLLHVLQVCPYDCRHTLATARSHISSCAQHQQTQQLDMFVYETEPEGLCRHMLLLSLLFDASLTARERAEMFLELHGNVMLRQGTADWVCESL